MGLFELAAFLLGVDVRKHMEADLIVGDETAEADAGLALTDELTDEDASAEPQPEEPVGAPSVLSQERQEEVKELIRQLDGGYRRRYRK